MQTRPSQAANNSFREIRQLFIVAVQWAAESGTVDSCMPTAISDASRCSQALIHAISHLLCFCVCTGTGHIHPIRLVHLRCNGSVEFAASA